MTIFGHGVMSNQQNKVSSCFCVYILQPWTPYSPLDRRIHTDFGNIVHEGRYRRDFVIAGDGVAIDGNGTPDPQNKVSSRYRVYILQAWTRYLPFDQFVNVELGYIVHEGQYRRDFAIVDDVGSTLVLPKSTKQGEFWLSCTYILQPITTYLPLDGCIHTDFGNIVCGGRY
jgi:hypothetical protein